MGAGLDTSTGAGLSASTASHTSSPLPSIPVRHLVPRWRRSIGRKWHSFPGTCLGECPHLPCPLPHTLPRPLLRRAYMQLASSPEAFLALRSNFTRSTAVASVCQYVLGIGDRHLSNFMVDLHSGGIVAIDFGHAFGTATQVRIWAAMATVFYIVHKSVASVLTLTHAALEGSKSPQLHLFGFTTNPIHGY